MVEQRMIERGIGSARAGELVKVETDLPPTCVVSSAEPAHKSRRSRVEQHCTTTECKTEHCLGDVVTDSRQITQGDFSLRHRTSVAFVQRLRYVDEQRRARS